MHAEDGATGPARTAGGGEKTGRFRSGARLRALGVKKKKER